MTRPNFDVERAPRPLCFAIIMLRTAWCVCPTSVALIGPNLSLRYAVQHLCSADATQEALSLILLVVRLPGSKTSQIIQIKSASDRNDLDHGVGKDRTGHLSRLWTNSNVCEERAAVRVTPRNAHTLTTHCTPCRSGISCTYPGSVFNVSPLPGPFHAFLMRDTNGW